MLLWNTSVRPPIVFCGTGKLQLPSCEARRPQLLFQTVLVVSFASFCSYSCPSHLAQRYIYRNDARWHTSDRFDEKNRDRWSNDCEVAGRLRWDICAADQNRSLSKKCFLICVCQGYWELLWENFSYESRNLEMYHTATLQKHHLWKYCMGEGRKCWSFWFKQLSILFSCCSIPRSVCKSTIYHN